jgi:RimJ/RimL family protein N-acetyltransferase
MKRGNSMALALEKSGLDEARVDLTPLHRDNLYKHFQWNNDPELNRLDSEVPFREETLSAFKRRFEQMIYQPAPNSRDFEICAEDGTVIGVAYVVNVSRHNRHCTLGITIGDRAYWGKGYGRASLRLLLGYCFDELGMHRVSAETFEYNTAWRKLVEWAGFKKEGTERDYLCRDGRFWDKEIYAILEGEYRSHLALAA